MNRLIEDHREQLAEACHRFGVQSLEIFGSITRADFDHAASDVDFIVRFRNAGEKGYADRYLAFAEELERILGRRVDLLTERSLRNPILIEHIARDRQIVDAA